QDVVHLDWRSVFFVGVAPALLTVWIRRGVEEPRGWRETPAGPARPTVRGHVRGRLPAATRAPTPMKAGTPVPYLGFNTWVPSYLRATSASGGAGLSNQAMSGLVFANQIGTWIGYVTFGYVSDLFGRKRAYVAYLVLAAVFVVSYTSTTNHYALLAL